MVNHLVDFRFSQIKYALIKLPALGSFRTDEATGLLRLDFLRDRIASYANQDRRAAYRFLLLMRTNLQQARDR